MFDREGFWFAYPPPNLREQWHTLLPYIPLAHLISRVCRKGGGKGESENWGIWCVEIEKPGKSSNDYQDKWMNGYTERLK